jgi:hypothetical protein
MILTVHRLFSGCTPKQKFVQLMIDTLAVQ